MTARWQPTPTGAELRRAGVILATIRRISTPGAYRLWRYRWAAAGQAGECDWYEEAQRACRRALGGYTP